MTRSRHVTFRRPSQKTQAQNNIGNGKGQLQHDSMRNIPSLRASSWVSGVRRCTGEEDRSIFFSLCRVRHIRRYSVSG